MCSQYLSKQRNKQRQTHKIVQIHSETVSSLTLLLEDSGDTFLKYIQNAVTLQFLAHPVDSALNLSDCRRGLSRLYLAYLTLISSLFNFLFRFLVSNLER